MGEADDAAGDLRAAGLLLALYTLQGIPMRLLMLCGQPALGRARARINQTTTDTERARV